MFASLPLGCAVQSYDPKTRTTHLWGFGHLKMRVAPAEDDPKLQAIAVGVQTVGARIDANSHTTGLSLGYSSSNFVEVVSSDTALRLDADSGNLFTLRLGGAEAIHHRP